MDLNRSHNPSPSDLTPDFQPYDTPSQFTQTRMTPEVREKIMELYTLKNTISEISRQTGFSRHSVSMVCNSQYKASFIERRKKYNQAYFADKKRDRFLYNLSMRRCRLKKKILGYTTITPNKPLHMLEDEYEYLGVVMQEYRRHLKENPDALSSPTKILELPKPPDHLKILFT